MNLLRALTLVDVHLGLTFIVLDITRGLLSLVAGDSTHDRVFLALKSVSDTTHMSSQRESQLCQSVKKRLTLQRIPGFWQQKSQPLPCRAASDRQWSKKKIR